jgi:hypothetical protein
MEEITRGEKVPVMSTLNISIHEYSHCRKKRLIEGNAKCRHPKNLPVKGGIYLSEAQNPIPPPPLTHCIRVYSILIHIGKGVSGGELNQREGESTDHNAWLKIPT